MTSAAAFLRWIFGTPEVESALWLGLASLLPFLLLWLEGSRSGGYAFLLLLEALAAGRFGFLVPRLVANSRRRGAKPA